MGSRLYPQIADTIARDRFRIVHTDQIIEGVVNDAARNMIEQIVTELRARPAAGAKRRVPNHDQEIKDILLSRGGGENSRSVTADLYIEDFTDGPLLIELKTPLPNLDIAAESKRKMLYFLLIMNRQQIKGAKSFLGLTYNPFVTRSKYAHSYTRQIMDMESEVLIGPELWNYLGGMGTYQELLNAIEEARIKI